MKHLFAVALTATTCISLSACGSSSDPMAAQAKTSLAKQLTAQATESSDPLKDPSTATCVANGLVDKIGVKQLQTYKLLDDKGNATNAQLQNTNASKTDATSFADTMFTCVGSDKIIAAVKDSIGGRLATAPAAVKTCVSNLLTADVVRGMLIAEAEGQTSTDAQATLKDFSAKLMACATAK